eukprot:7827682-Ditylum_brightwellii.AAC.1
MPLRSYAVIVVQMVSILVSQVNILCWANMGLGPGTAVTLIIQCHCYWKQLIALRLDCGL